MPDDQTIRLTPIQQGMVFHQLVDPRSGVDIEQIVIALEQPVDRARLEAAWQSVIDAHAALRCRVVEDESGDYALSPIAQFRPELKEVELRSADDLHAWLAADRTRGFDIFADVPLRLALLHGGGEPVRCVWSFHHILLDGRSFADVLTDVLDAYDALSSGAIPTVAPRPDAAAFGDWLRRYDRDRARAYWRQVLAGVSEPTPFPPPTAASGPKRMVERRLNAAVTASLERLAVSLDVTLNSIVQAAWSILLARYADQDTVVFGVTRAGRAGHLPEAARTLGVFINTVPVRAEVGSRTVAELVRSLRAQQVDARRYEHVSLADVQSDSFRTLLMFDHEDLDGTMHRLRPQWSGRRFELHEQTSYPITLYAYAKPALRLKLAYVEEALERQQAERLLEHLVTLLLGMTHDPRREARRLSMLGTDERRLVEVEWNRTAQASKPTTIHAAFRAAVAATPAAPALTAARRTLSFAEVAASVDRVVVALQTRGVGRGAVVGLCVDRSVEMVTCMLGILEAGAAYLPLDPSYPVDRLAFCARDAGIALVVTERRHAHRFAGAGIGVVLVEELEAAPATPRAVASDAQDLAYVIYTSGSTGRPKGVLVTHANVSNFFSGMDDVIDVRAGKRWLAVTSTSFDISVLELLWTLTRGFEVVIHGARDRMRPDRVGGPAFSLFHFASGMDASDPQPYRLITEAARFADRHGFEAVWSPERHFHDFGAPYPNPSVMSAALATITTRVQLRAGSVVLPLHDPLRVAEEWALVDQLSRGRVGVAFASGWQPNDFVLAPDNYARRKELMFEQIERVRALWRGERVSAKNPKGDDVALGTYPRPVQPELPIWITAAGSPDTFRRAGSIGANVLTHMLGQSVRDLAEQIAAYRAARAAAGLDPASGRVTVMVHTFLGESTDAVREVVRRPMKDYLRSSASLVGGYADAWTAYKRGAGAQIGATAMSELSPEELDELYEFAFERYFESAGLFGSVEKASPLVEALREAGVDEIACLIDFGVAAETVIEHLPWIDQLRSSVNRVAQESHDDVVRDIEAHEITHLQCTPSLARMIPLLARDSKALATLRQMLIGGETLPRDLVRDLYALLPGDASIFNMYGPTETTIWSTVDAVPRGTERVTIGRPIANTQCHVVDSHRELVPPGQVGELLIGGDGVAVGYHERPELTAERFFDLTVGGERRRCYATGDLVRHLPDGRLEYVGRRDFQVKVRGHRIELGEIESALRAEAGIRDAVVVARSDSIGAEQLVGYLVPSRGASHRIEVESLKSALRGRLPDYMIPSTFVWLEALPLTPNGKIDRKALPEPMSAGARDERDVHAPRTDVEAAIREVWQRVLGVPNVGVKSNFFDLGGHSILAVKVQSELSKLFGRRLPIAELFRAPTIEMLAKHFSADEAGQPAQATTRGVDRARQRRAALTRRLRNSDRGEP